MTLSRWKLLAGVFGLSVCGLAALAEPACRTAGHGNPRQLPTVAENKSDPKSGSVAIPPPIPVSPPKPADVKPTPAPAPLPSLPPALPNTVSPKPELGEPVELTLPMLKDEKLPAFPLPSLPSPSPNVPGSTAVPDATPLPALPAAPGAKPSIPESLPLPMPVDTKAGGLPPFLGSPPAPKSPEVKPVPTPPPPTMPLPPPPSPTPEVRTVEARAATPTVQKRLKVTLQMGEGNPRFEIRDGDEVVLKVTSDKIDVQAPTEKGDLWSTLKASGRVKFQSPGGDGYCDELQIVPGSCEVIATGKVQFKYNWGKVETAVTSERMTFRLGATPDSP